VNSEPTKIMDQGAAESGDLAVAATSSDCTVVLDCERPPAFVQTCELPALEDPLALAAQGEVARGSRCGLIPGYSVLGELGRGAMSVVYQAVQEKLNRVVALKVLSPNQELGTTCIDLFQREAKAVGALNHPNIVTAFDYGEERGRFYLALEYIDGANCLELIERDGPLDEATALRIIRGAILGLSHALEHGIIHRDVKPANLLFSSDGPRDARHLERASMVKVTDLGLALMEETALGSTREQGRRRIIAGTPAYMAPEQARGEDVDCRADIYGLGASLYHMLTAVKPFDVNSLAELVREKESGHLVHPQDLVGTIRSPLCWLLEKMLARDPEHRYQSYEVLLADVDTLLEGEVPHIKAIEREQSSLAAPTTRGGMDRRRSDWLRIQDLGDEDPSRSRLRSVLTSLGWIALGAGGGWIFKALFG
jgi:serine/threonine protein kinase